MLSVRVSVIGSTAVTTPTGATAGLAAIKSRIAWILVSMVVAVAIEESMASSEATMLVRSVTAASRFTMAASARQ